MKTPERTNYPHWYLTCFTIILFAVTLFLPVLGNTYLNSNSKEHDGMPNSNFRTTNAAANYNNSNTVATHTSSISKHNARHVPHLPNTRFHKPASIHSKRKISYSKSIKHFRRNYKTSKRPIMHNANTSPDKLFTLLGNSIQMEALHFQINAVLPPAGKWKEGLDSTLQPYINGLEAYDSILVVGYTDNTGSKKGNLQLSAERAKNIVIYLIQQGIPEHRIHMAAIGQEQPVTTNKTIEGRNLNRRVEINFLRSS